MLVGLVLATIAFTDVSGRTLQSHQMYLEKKFCGASSTAAVVDNGTTYKGRVVISCGH